MPKTIIANWKSNHNLETALEWGQQLVEFFQNNSSLSGAVASQELEVVLAPPSPFLINLHEQLEGLGVKLAIQDISSFAAGSYTGEVGAHNLEGLGVEYALVGHSERRQQFGETNQEVALKAVRALQAGIKPVVCVDQPYLEAQLRQLSQELAKEKVEVASGDLLIAYEPVEAIGSGQSAEPEQVRQLAQEISAKLPQAKVLYGGSVTASNVASYLAVCDGALVGGSSLQAASFAQLLERAVGLENLED